MQTTEEALLKLSKSAFRSSFHLSEKDRKYMEEKGEETIKKHAVDFVNDRLKSLRENDGKQTPFHGHPVFKAMHATACCCRGCLEKWYRVDKNAVLSDEQCEKIVNLIMAWLRSQEKK